MTRRDVLRGLLGAAVWLAAGRRRPARAQATPAAREVWARIDAVGDGVWAVVSTPNPDDRTSFATLCNGGIVAGRERVLVFEGFGSADGAAVGGGAGAGPGGARRRPTSSSATTTATTTAV